MEMFRFGGILVKKRDSFLEKFGLEDQKYLSGEEIFTLGEESFRLGD